MFLFLISSASSNFNEKPYTEEKKRFTAKYVGSSEVSKPSGEYRNNFLL